LTPPAVYRYHESVPEVPKSSDFDADPMDDGLTAQQHRAIDLMLMEPKLGNVAATVGISDRGLYKWTHDQKFRDVLRRRQREAFSQSTRRLTQLAPEAVETLADLVKNGTSKDSCRLSAAKAILDLGHSAIELDEVVEQVEKIEMRMTAMEGRRNEAQGDS
jgi:hypothetical protein